MILGIHLKNSRLLTYYADCWWMHNNLNDMILKILILSTSDSYFAIRPLSNHFGEGLNWGTRVIWESLERAYALTFQYNAPLKLCRYFAQMTKFREKMPFPLALAKSCISYGWLTFSIESWKKHPNETTISSQSIKRCSHSSLTWLTGGWMDKCLIEDNLRAVRPKQCILSYMKYEGIYTPLTRGHLLQVLSIYKHVFRSEPLCAHIMIL